MARFLYDVMTDVVARCGKVCDCDKKEPVPFEYFDQWVKDWEENVAQSKAKLETAEGAERQELVKIIEQGEKLLENKEEHRWEVSDDMIANYENIATAFYIPSENQLNTRDEDNNIYRLLENYTKGAMTLDQFIQEANRRVQMATIESE